MMKRIKKGAPYLVIAAFITFVATIVTVYFYAGSASRKEGHRPFSDLIASAPRLQSVRFQTPECLTDIVRTEDKWLLASADGFPVDESAVAELLRNMSGWEFVEKKQVSPKNFGKLRLADPEKAPASEKFDLEEKKNFGGRVKITDKSGAVIGDFIAGKRVSGYLGGAKKRFYFRYSASKDVYVVEADRYPEFCAGPYLTADLGVPPFKKITAVEVTYAGKQKLKLVRSKKGEGDFVISGIPKGSEPIYPKVAEDYVRALTLNLRPTAIYDDSSGTKKGVKPNIAALILRSKDKQPVKIEFWRENEYSFMNLRNTDKFYNETKTYRISEKTFKILSQPFTGFLKKKVKP